MVKIDSPRWEDLEDREYRCPKCLHWWVSHGVPTDGDYGCNVIESSAAERWEMSQRARELQHQGLPPQVAGLQAYRDLRYCGCAFAEGNPVTPRQVRIWRDGTSWPLAPWERADCDHLRLDAQQCLDCGVAASELKRMFTLEGRTSACAARDGTSPSKDCRSTLMTSWLATWISGDDFDTGRRTS